MNETNTNNDAARDAGQKAFTHIGFDEYHGKQHIYTGCFETQASGTAAEVIAYLEQTKAEIPASEESLQWQGQNGIWYSGDNARKAIDAEIAELRDGSHPCFRVDE